MGGTCTSEFDGPEDFAADFPLQGDHTANYVAFMNSIPYGTWDQPSSNTLPVAHFTRCLRHPDLCTVSM